MTTTTGLLTTVLAMTGAAAAGAPAQAAQEAGPESLVLEEILVTAQKREERLIEIPLSLSVLTGDTLETLNVQQLRDFANTVPALSYTSAGVGQTQLTLRGVTAGRDIGPTVGVYVDDVPTDRAAPSRMRRLSHWTWASTTSIASRCCAGRKERCTARARWVDCSSM